MNAVVKPNTKIVDYSTAIRHFVEQDLETGLTTYGNFREGEPMTAKIIRSANATVVIFSDGSKGVARCSEGDEFSYKKGLRIAYNRAMIEHLQKEIEKLCKS